MSKKIRIIVPSIGIASTEIDDRRNKKTANAIWEALPIRGAANRWGDEIYFSIPADVGEENSQQVVELGDLGYWPPGHAFCIFFGRTPVSIGDEPRAYSPVNVFGKVTGDPKIFRRVRNGEEITIEREE
jgi:hypothetical protein